MRTYTRELIGRLKRGEEVTLLEAERALADLGREIAEICAQLNQPERRENTAWLHSARHALSLMQKTNAELKALVKKARVSGQYEEIKNGADFDPHDPSAVLTAALVVFNRWRREYEIETLGTPEGRVREALQECIRHLESQKTIRMEVE